YPDKILYQRMDRYGYLRMSLYKNSKPKTMTIHRIVAENFIPNEGRKLTVNHKDGNKLNNKLNNLGWATWSEYNQHALDTGLRCKDRKSTRLNSSHVSIS